MLSALKAFLNRNFHFAIPSLGQYNSRSPIFDSPCVVLLLGRTGR
jgi:hypothetical protein